MHAVTEYVAVYMSRNTLIVCFLSRQKIVLMLVDLELFNNINNILLYLLFDVQLS